MLHYLIRKSNKIKLNTLAFGFLTGTSVLALWAFLLGHYTLVLRAKRDDGIHGDFINYQALLKWQVVRTDNAYVLNAYYDDREREGNIKVIGIEKLDQGPGVCLLWYPWRKDPTVVTLRKMAIPEHHGKEYWPYIYTCPVNNTEPVAVSIVKGELKHPPNLLPIPRVSQHKDLKKVNFTVCVAVLHRHYDNHHQVVEAIELYRMFGAQKVVIYSYSIGPNVARLLKYYTGIGVVELVKWSIPVPDDELHYYGQIPAINDCIYRYMHVTKYLVFSDFDEIIVPRKFTTWTDMMNTVAESSKHARWSGAYVFQNAFFPLDCRDSPAFTNSSLITSYQITTLLKSVRLGQLWPHLVRSKCIVRPDAVTMSGIHYMWGFTGNYTHYNVSSNIATLHHYRQYMKGCSEWREDSFMWVEDKTMFKFRRDITKRIWRTMITIGDCGQPPLTSSDLASFVVRDKWT